MSERRFFVGIDPAADGEDTTVLVEKRDDHLYILGLLHGMSTDEIKDAWARATGKPVVIEGEYRVVENRPDRLLDAGGSEP